MNQHHPLLGEQITRLIRTLAAIKGWSMTGATRFAADQTGYGPDMIHRWRQGKGKPSPDTTRILAEIGSIEASLDRTWGESFLHAAYYPDVVTLLNTLWPTNPRTIPCNLPTPGHTTFIGRQKEITDLLALLSPQYAANLISVDGIGGVGKTALVLEAAYRSLRASTGETPNSKIPTFDAIIFVSAKQRYLTPSGLLLSFEAERTLRDLFREIAQTLNRFEITQATPQEQPSKVRDALSRQRTLLIVDNLETMEEKQEIVAFLYRLPPQVKVVMTTREKALFSPIQLNELEEAEALNLIEKEAHEKKVVLAKEQALILYRRIGGIPAALVYSIGQVASGFSVKTVLDRVLKANGDVARFCFEGSISRLRGHPGHTLLMAMAMFPKQPVREAIMFTAGLISDPLAVEEGLAQLQQLSLVSLQNGRYSMLPLTREYALAELVAYAEFEREARNRWIEWYIHFAEEYGGKEWQEWHIHFDRVEEEWENLLTVFNWCAAHECYDELRIFWLPETTGGIEHVANIYGYWNDRLTWIYWLIQASERRGDWPTIVRALLDVGYTLTIMGHLEEADEFLSRAWSFREHATPRILANLAQEIADLRIYQKKFADALLWFDQAKTILDTAMIDEPERTRRKINSLYYYGIMCYEQQDYMLAEGCFRDMVEQAQHISWQRATIYAQNWLAELAIIYNRLDEAEDLLQMGLPVAERNHDKRRTAHYKRSYAYLRSKQGNIEEARRYAEEARDGFERLGMQLEVEELQALLRQLHI